MNNVPPLSVSASRRRRELELLLSTVDDHLGADRFGKVWGGYDRALAGPAPSTKQPCRACDATGRTIPSGRPCVACAKGQALGSHPCAPCQACAGRRYVWVDAYTGAVVAFEERKTRRVQQGSGAKARKTVHAAGLEEHVGRWHEAAKRQQKEGSYAELRDALRRLNASDPVAHRAVVAVHVRGVCSPDDFASPRALHRGMGLLDAWMPKPLRLPRHLAEVVAVEQRRHDVATVRAGQDRSAPEWAGRGVVGGGRRTLGVRERHLR